MNPVDVVRGDAPIVLGLPHTGTWIPDEVEAQLNEVGRARADTDWHIDRLYSGLIDGVTTVRANFHRYLIDANRDPSGQSLYPGQNTTGLVPLTDFDGREIWSTAPTAADIEDRRLVYHAPYHVALNDELARVHGKHGYVVLYDCHSIRSNIPFLFDGILPDFNIGTNNGSTCADVMTKQVEAICQGAEGYSCVTNGRFKGGWTTRHYGRPKQGWHAIQMELAQSTYMQEEPPWAYDTTKADRLRNHLATILTAIENLAREGALT